MYLIQISRLKFFTFLFSIIFNFLNTTIYSQNPDEIVGKAGGTPITIEEFKLRFELSPRPRIDNYFDTTLTKLDFLKTIIAEKLLAQEAIREGMEKSPEYIRNIKYVRNLYLRDALYNIEVKDKIVIPDSEIAKGKAKIGKNIKTKFIFSQDKNEIFQIYESLKNGSSFDSILFLRHENEEQKQPAEITFGKMNERIEDFLFTLRVGEFTPPVELEEGWYICKAYSVTEKGFLDEADLRKIERVVSDRIENKTYKDFYKRIFKGVIINADRNIFTLLNEALNRFINENENYLIKKNGRYTLYGNGISIISKQLNEEKLNSIFIKFPQNPINLNGFFDFMSIEGFDFLSTDSSHIHSRLNAYVSTFIQNEILAREAFRRGYDKLPEVAANLNMWREHYLSKLMMKRIYKEEDVSDDEAYEFYSKNNRLIMLPDEVKVAEILTDDLDTVKKIFEELDKGSDFIELAKQYTLRDSLKNYGCVFDFTPANKEGEIWKTASNIKVGEVFGPLILPEGFSIIKLLEKRDAKWEKFESFDEAKVDIKNILKTQKLYGKLENITAKLAVDNFIEVNEKVLNSIKVNNVNIIVYKRFGFGGQQPAVPHTPNFSSWFIKYEELKKSVTF